MQSKERKLIVVVMVIGDQEETGYKREMPRALEKGMHQYVNDAETMKGGKGLET